MKDLYSPELRYSFALEQATAINRAKWPQFPTQHPPVTIAEMFGYIAHYLQHRDLYRHSKIGFIEYLFAQVAKRLAAPLLAAEPRAGMIEFRIVRFQDMVNLIYPGDLNNGWQSVEYKRQMEKATIYHGYVPERADARALCDRFIAHDQEIAALKLSARR